MCIYQTLSGDDEAGHTVRDAGAGCQERDSHDDFWDSKCVADYGHLDRKHKRKLAVYMYLCV